MSVLSRLAIRFLTTCFFFNDTATTEIYTLSLHDALPIYVIAMICPGCASLAASRYAIRWVSTRVLPEPAPADRKSTRLNSSHANISYAVFCLKKKKVELGPD